MSGWFEGFSTRQLLMFDLDNDSGILKTTHPAFPFGFVKSSGVQLTFSASRGGD